MGWSELRGIPNEYNQTIKEIDERIIELISLRRTKVEGRRYYPSIEQIAEWSTRFELDESQIHYIMQSLQDQIRLDFPDELGELNNVLSIMKKSVAESCEYTLTHAMQYEKASIVFVEIKLLDNSQGEVHLKPNLFLHIINNQQYSVRRHGSRGGGAQTEMQFMVIPPLPENLENLEFSLVPTALFAERKIKEVILNKQIDFK
ncbi:hypothetical protein [Gorillibacterium massiliense]|uniref:hypothetical protein n=1 Tax=Gorillibacterium massiliense TaxID=1280390 RepID=UPI000593F920|nr:hypothetical protein [Gorillibacterium massiliense]